MTTKSLFAKPNKQKALIKACNLLAAHLTDKLPEGWEIRISFRRGEASAELIDPHGETFDNGPPDHGTSELDDYCVTALTWEDEV